MFCPCFWITPSAQCFGDSGERASSLGKSGGGGGTGKKPHPQSPTENLLADYSSSVE